MYRPQTNVVTRPVAGIGKGYSLVGHHEILIPLLAAALSSSQLPVTGYQFPTGSWQTGNWKLRYNPEFLPV